MYINEKRKKLIRDLSFKGEDEGVARFVRKMIGKVAFSLFYLSHPWKVYNDRDFFREDGRHGLLVGSIVQNPLYVPNLEEKGLNFELNKASAGKWYGFDFYRKLKFGKKANSLKDGKFMSFVLSDIEKNDMNSYTPTERFQLFDIGDLAHMEMPSVDYLLRVGLLKSTTYGQAFRNLNLEKSLKETTISSRIYSELEDSGFSEKEVYQVTPKGNGLIFLVKDGGMKTPKKYNSKVPFFEPALAPVSTR